MREHLGHRRVVGGASRPSANRADTSTSSATTANTNANAITSAAASNPSSATTARRRRSRQHHHHHSASAGSSSSSSSSSSSLIRRAWQLGRGGPLAYPRYTVTPPPLLSPGRQQRLCVVCARVHKTTDVHHTSVLWAPSVLFEYVRARERNETSQMKVNENELTNAHRQETPCAWADGVASGDGGVAGGAAHVPPRAIRHGGGSSMHLRGQDRG